MINTEWISDMRWRILSQQKDTASIVGAEDIFYLQHRNKNKYLLSRFIWLIASFSSFTIISSLC